MGDTVLDQAIEVATRLQDLLGEIHDCDLWQEFLTRFEHDEEERALEYAGTAVPMRRLRPGLEWWRADRLAQREQRYTEFVEYWDRNRALWERFAIGGDQQTPQEQ
jgi:hypothetical protein